VIGGFLLVTAGVVQAASPAADSNYYTEPSLYTLRPNPQHESKFGDVGVTGLRLHVYPGVVLKVMETVPNTPADGKFKKDEIITGVNGKALNGLNPFVVFGEALTQAEAKDGKLVFDVLSSDGKEAKQVTVVIPVMGAYSKTWPLKCKKSEAIVNAAAAYYAKNEKGGVEGALRCLFLLSTGDDQYLPLVKTYLNKMGANVQSLGDCTWNRGYSGMACAEYYLRTGDQSVLPLLQHFCDNARDGMAYGIGWAHGTGRCNPRYMEGLMNPASAQLVTTLLLSKECGVQVDEKTLLGSLKFFYRFAGHGTIAYGDHRGEGGLGSNGKDGMVAAIMQIASEAKGDVSIYTQARNYLALSMLDSYPVMTMGHADNGRGDAIWRGISTTYLMDLKPDAFRKHLDSLKWYYDLSRRPSGALGIASCQSFDDEASGAALALAYTAPRKTLRITGAPSSKFAKTFTLPAQLWGRKADLAFLSTENGKPYSRYGAEEPIHVPFFKFGNAYAKPEADFTKMPREEMLKNLYHRNYMIRVQAAKALMSVGALDELEKLLQDKDPRIRRAALDGLLDHNYFFGMGKNAITPERITPGMLAAFRKMVADPEEALYVVDGALLALSCSTPAEIEKSFSVIQPWTTSDEWWTRQGAFFALAKAAEDETLAPKMLPILSEMLWRENRPMARNSMNARMTQLAKKYKPTGETGKAILAIFKKAVDETQIESGFRGGAGGFYVKNALLSGVTIDPSQSLEMAKALQKRLPLLRTDYLVEVTEKLVSLVDKLPEPDKTELSDLLYGDYRKAFIQRMSSGDPAEVKLDILSALAHLKDKNAGWRELGCNASTDRVWQFTSFDPQAKDALKPYVVRRFRDVTLPTGLEKWYKPEFDASAWSSGKAPIGKGVYAKHGVKFANRSAWGEGEFLLARTTFEVDSLDYDYVRLAVLANQGYRIYLNGFSICSIGWSNQPQYRQIDLDPNQIKRLKKGTNVLAVYANAMYKDNKEGEQQIGQFDMRLEGLRKADLLKEGQ
jgi:hypothetical protein